MPENIASANCACILGGENNTAAHDKTIILGGVGNVTTEPLQLILCDGTSVKLTEQDFAALYRVCFDAHD